MSASFYFEHIGFIAVAILTLGSALGVILARRVLHAALWLLPTLIGVAAAFGIMGAHVLFAMQIVVYVGAITILILFGVMLLEDDARESLPRYLKKHITMKMKPATDLVLHYYSGMQHVIGGVVATTLMAVITLAAITEAAWFQQWKPLRPEKAYHFTGDNVRVIGEAFLTTYLLPFEVASVVLLIALVGAVILARREAVKAPADEPVKDETSEGGEAQ